MEGICLGVGEFLCFHFSGYFENNKFIQSCKAAIQNSVPKSQKSIRVTQLRLPDVVAPASVEKKGQQEECNKKWSDCFFQLPISYNPGADND